MRKHLNYFIVFTLLLATILIGGCDMLDPKLPEPNTTYPESPITMIVPFSVGGGTDLQARVFEKYVPKYLNQNLVVVNRPGGGGTIGWNELVTTEPNGYTIGMSASEIIMQPLLGETKYHYPTALEPIVQFSSTPMIIIVNAEQPWNTLNELIEYGKQNPNALKYGHGGLGEFSHVLGAAFAKYTDTQIEAVPFHGGGEVLSALLGNHIQIAFASPAVVKEQLNAGKVKALAITGEQRLHDPDLSQIPTCKELDIDLTLSIWYGVAAPKQLPQDIKEKLSDAFQQIIADPEFKEMIEKLGMQVDYLDTEQSKVKWGAEMKKYSKMLNETGIAEQIKEQRK